MSGFPPPSASTFPSKLCISLHHDTTTMRENVEKLKNNFLSFSFTTLTTEGKSKFMEWEKAARKKCEISKNDKEQRIFRFPCCHVSSRGFLFLWNVVVISRYAFTLLYRAVQWSRWRWDIKNSFRTLARDWQWRVVWKIEWIFWQSENCMYEVDPTTIL